jgi:glycosyltransferase involved in cell wall biosynthesis
MIECDYYREKYRIEHNGVTQPSGTILNTIPMSELSESIGIPRHKNDVPVIVYSGGIHFPGEFDIIVDALKDIPYEFIMEFYCFGNQEAIRQLEISCNSKLEGKYRLIINQPRKNVYAAIRNADIGIVYYDPEYSINTLYAAPTKFYEYVGLNVPIVCSANESLMYIIQKYNLGEVMPENNSTGMKLAIEKLLRDDKYREIISRNEKDAFEAELCYEKQSRDVLSTLLKMIRNS